MANAATSILSFIAAGFYLVVLAGCVAAYLAAQRFRQPPSHWRTWAFLAISFLVLALLRLVGFEDSAREALRELLALEGSYDNRRSFQRPLAAGLVAVASAMVALGLMRQWQLARGRRNVALVIALAGLAVMVAMLGLRLVSLHQVDMLLYGPMKLNWILDLGASLTVLGAAVLYIHYVRKRP